MTPPLWIVQHDEARTLLTRYSHERHYRLRETLSKEGDAEVPLPPAPEALLDEPLPVPVETAGPAPVEMA